VIRHIIVTVLIGYSKPPKSASVIEISPTTVLLDIEAPNDNGGVDIYGYRIIYLLKIEDFMLGMFSLTISSSVYIFAEFKVITYYCRL